MEHTMDPAARLAFEIIRSRLPDMPNTVAVAAHRVKVLEDALREIFHHAYDDDTSPEDLRSDIDSMRGIARDALGVPS